MSAHTPGPLRAISQGIWAGDRRIGGSDSPYAYVSYAEAHANAVLWAASPNLLAALQLMLSHGERCNWFADRGDEEVCEVARAAIAKATGGAS